MQAEQDLVRQHVEYAKALARQIAQTLPRHAKSEDLEGYAMVGLAEAGRDFDPSAGTAFTTFAYFRVRGAVFDGIRKMSWTRRARRSARAEAGAHAVAGDRAWPGRDAPVEQVAAQVDDAIRAIGTIFLLSQAGDADRPVEPASGEDDSPAERVHSAEMIGRLRNALPKLPPEHARILQMFYFDELTMTEIGERLGKNKSSISRAHGHAIRALGEVLRDD